MKAGATQLAFAAVLLAGVTLLIVGAPHDRAPPAPRETPPAAVAQVAGGGVTLASVGATLPDEVEALPAGPNRDTVAADCTACHSAGMIAAQPPLKPEQWEATVKKMREVYHASVPEADVPAILAYLNALSDARRGGQASPAAAATSAAATP